jgi:trans-aconitate methyltransferase
MPDTANTYGTDAPAYALTQSIRLEANRLFRQALGLARVGAPFRKGERILDVGCGQRDYFECLWRDQPDVHVTGIDCDKNVTDWEDTSALRKLRKGNFFDAGIFDEKFDILQASFAMTWLTGPGDQSTGAPTKLEAFFSRAKSLLNNGGWLIAHHPGDEDFFPDFNKIIVHCIAQKTQNAEAKVRDEYFKKRREKLASPSLASIRSAAAREGFRVHFLAKSLEWIPIRSDDFIPYWESGGKSPFQEWLSGIFGDYDEFLRTFNAILNNKKTLASLGIERFTREGKDFILLPAWHEYFIAELFNKKKQAETFSGLSWSAIEAPLQSHAYARKDAFDEKKADSWLENGASSVKAVYAGEDSKLAYLMLVDALERPPKAIGKYFDHLYKDKESWVRKGAEWELQTFTASLRALLKPLKSKPSPIAVIGVTIDKSELALKLLSGAQPIEIGDGEILRYCFLWQDGTLNSDAAQNRNGTDRENLGYELIKISENYEAGWPRVFMTSDDAVQALKQMCEKDQSSRYIEPLWYFDWQTRITAPNPQSFMLATTLVRGGGEDPVGLPSIFAMIERPGDSTSFSQSQWLLQDTLSTQVLLALGTGVMATKMVEALKNLHSEQDELRRSHQMLLKLQRPLDVLTNAFADVQAEAQEMQAILNDPEEGLFKAHKLLAPLFQDGHEVEVSDFLSVTAYHNWEHDSERNTREVLQRAYCYAVCSIFGIEGALSSAQSQAALIQLARKALKEARTGGVFSKLIATVELVLGIETGTLEESVLLNDIADTKKEGERFQHYLQILKRVCFTPFKEFGSFWPNAPAQLAALGNTGLTNLDTKGRTLEPFRTPFAQHAILTFILEAKSFLRQEAKQNDRWAAFQRLDIEPATAAGLKEYKLQVQASTLPARNSKWNGEYYCAALDKRTKIYGGDLHECLKAAIRFGVVGRNVGNFHGIFQNLVRHGLGITHYPARAGSWVLLKPSESHPVIVGFGKLKGDAEDEVALCSADCSHYFAIIESAVNNLRYLRIVWTDDKNELIGNPGQENAAQSTIDTPPSPIELTEAQASPPTAPYANLIATKYHSVIVLDHDANATINYHGAWFQAISSIPLLNGRVTAAYEGVPKNLSWLADDQHAVVVLHTGDGRGPEWRQYLETDTHIIKVIVVSTGGMPTSKGIPEDGKFVHCDVKPGDLEDGGARQEFLMHIQNLQPI